MPPSSKSFTVIIPAHNAAKTLPLCLKAVGRSTITPDQLWVVNDTSTDTTRAIAAGFPCKIIDCSIKAGPMQPRFLAAGQAETDILVFVDADVVVSCSTFSRILKHFDETSVAAITGRLSPKTPDGQFFSRFKNAYMNCVFGRQPSCVDFLYGSIFAVRKEALIYFDPICDPFGSLVSDSELGFRISAAGKTIVLDRGLQVVHLKSYGFFSLLKNDFIIPFLFARMFRRYAGYKRSHRRKSFSHAASGQVLMTAASFTGILALPAGSVTGETAAFGLAAASFAALNVYWLPLLILFKRRYGIFFAAAASLFLWLDQAVMFAGMICGFLYDRFKPDPGLAFGTGNFQTQKLEPHADAI